MVLITKLRVKLLDDDRTQIEIAKAAGMPPSRLSEYALARKRIPIQHLFSLARELKCNPDELVGVWEGEQMELDRELGEVG